jgi:DNA-binding CsgD family transcriptional regulator/tetratricopeptide (TPR) repeat protein
MGMRVSSPILVGRASDLEALLDALGTAATGQASVVLLAGAAGIGKSRLIREFASLASERGARVIVGSSIDLGEGALPLGAWADAFRDLAEGDGATSGTTARDLFAHTSQSGRRRRELDPERDRGTQALLFEAVLGTLGEMSATQPLVVVLEDLHWADRSTLDLFAFVATHARRQSLLLVGTYRDLPRHGRHPLNLLLLSLERRPGVTSLTLPALEPSQIRAQIDAIAGGTISTELADRIAERAEGNPLFAEELLAAGDRGPLPASVRDALIDRSLALSDGARLVSSIVAVAGRGISDVILSRVADVDDSTLESALREVIDLGVLEVAGDGYRFRHSLLADAVSEDLLPRQRRRLHGRVADGLSEGLTWREDPVRLAEIAYHRDAAGDARAALVAWVDAARAAREALAFAEALRHAERAIDLWDDVPDARELVGVDRPGILALASEDAWLAGDLAVAISHLHGSIAATPADQASQRTSRLQRLASFLSATGDDEAAIDALRDAESSLPSEPTLDRARILTTRSALLMLVGRYRESLRLCHEALAVARAVGAAALEVQIHNFLGVDLVGLGQLEDGLDHLQEAVRLGLRHGPPVDLVEAINNLSFMLSRADRYEEAATIGLEGIEAADRAGLARLEGSRLRSTTAYALFRLGRWDEAERLLTEGLALQPTSDATLSLHRDRGAIAALRGRFDAAAVDLAEATRVATRLRRADSLPTLAAVLGELALWQGDHDAARTAIANGLYRAAETEEGLLVAPLLALGVRAEADRAEHARAARLDMDLAAAVTEGHELVGRLEVLLDEMHAAGRSPAPSVLAELSGARAELSRLEDASDPSRWDEAARAWEALHRPYAVAYARWRQAAATFTAGDRSTAAAILRDAYDLAAGLGAQPLMEAIEQLAQRARVPLREVELRRKPATSKRPFRLTRREVEVLELVSAGRTNRQIAEELFITEKTAGLHVSNILGKLGVSNRFEAAYVAERAGIVG